MRPITASLLGLAALVLGGCINIAEELEAFPDTLDAGAATLSGRDYPRLADVPTAPTDLPNDQDWAQFQDVLQIRGDILRQSKEVTAPPTEPPEWAETVRQSLAVEPRLRPPEPSDLDLSWAEAARARVEAARARLPD